MRLHLFSALMLSLILPLGLRAAAETGSPQYAEIPVGALSVSGGQQPSAWTLTWWYSEAEDCRYLFLPAAADRAALTLSYTLEEGSSLLLNGTAVAPGEVTDLLATDDLFTVQVDDLDCGTLRVMHSNLGSVWLTLGEGELARLDSDRAARTEGTALMLTAEGEVTYRGALERFGGRGNSSWDYAQKKPYNLKLPKKAALFGMGSARKWALLGNQLDESMLRNQVAFDLARQAGLSFTPDSVFVDLYIDGGYRGTYQLTERVNVHPERVDIRDLEEETEALNPLPLEAYPRITAGRPESAMGYAYYDISNDPADITGGYLFQFQLPGRAEKGLFTTAQGQICDIVSPEYPSRAQTEYLRQFVQEMEDAVYSETGYNARGRHYTEYLDVDSLLLGWLVQEITENADGAATSFFFYKDSDLTGDGRLHYGPVWDFDLSCMNFRTLVHDPAGGSHYSFHYDTLFALYRHSAAGGEGLLSRLWRRDDVALRATVLYEARFDRYVTALSDRSQAGGALIEQLRDGIAPSAEMNAVRWQGYIKPLGPRTGEDFAGYTEYVRAFLMQRQRFLREMLQAEGIARSGLLLEALFAQHGEGAYDAPERAQRAELYAAAEAQLAAAETATEAAEAYAAAEAALAAVPMTELSGDFDVDGAVTLLDAQRMLMHYVAALGGKEAAVDATQRRNGDVNRDGVLDVVDATHILQHYTSSLAGEEYPLPIERVECEELSVET